MKKFFLFITVVALLCVSKASDAQYMNNSSNGNARTSTPTNEDYHLMDHLYFGGGFVAEFGNLGGAVGVSPIVGYKLNDRLSAGVGVQYIYLTGVDYNYNNVAFPYQTSVYGGDVFGRYRITPKIFAYAEYGFTDYEVPVIDFSGTDHYNYNVNVPDFLIGGGYTAKIGRNAAFEILVLYDLLYNPTYSYEPSPIVIRPGFTFGF